MHSNFEKFNNVPCYPIAARRRSNYNPPFLIALSSFLYVPIHSETTNFESATSNGILRIVISLVLSIQIFFPRLLIGSNGTTSSSKLDVFFFSRTTLLKKRKRKMMEKTTNRFLRRGIVGFLAVKLGVGVDERHLNL